MSPLSIQFLAFTFHWRFQGGERQGCAPRGPNCFIFRQFLAKNLQNNRLIHPIWELAPTSGKSWICHCLWYLSLFISLSLHLSLSLSLFMLLFSLRALKPAASWCVYWYLIMFHLLRECLSKRNLISWANTGILQLLQRVTSQKNKWNAPELHHS